MVLEISVYGDLAAGSIARKYREAPCFMAARKQRQRPEWARGKVSFKDTPPVTYFLQVGPTLNVSNISQNGATSWDHAVHV
jgi:hypothetical protein